MKLIITSSRLNKTAILFILLSLYFSFIIEGWVGFDKSKITFLLLSYIFFSIGIILRPNLTLPKAALEYFSIGVFFMLISCWFWWSLKEINVYITLITTIVVISGFDYFKKYVLWIFYLVIVIAIGETLFKDYLFILYRDTPWGFKPLDPVLFGGFSGIFRAKGLFEGPLALGQFSVGIALLFRKNIKIILLCIFGAILAASRLGMVIGSGILIVHLLEYYNILKFFLKKQFVFGIIVVITLTLFILPFLLNASSIERLLDSFSFGDSSNSARLYYWTKAIEIFSSYDWIHIIFGNSGYYRHIIGNSAENGWLMLLLNNGLLGFFFYLTPIISLAYLSFKYKTAHILYLILLFLSMTIQTFHLGLSANLFYWLIVYSFYKEITDKISQTKL